MFPMIASGPVCPLHIVPPSYDPMMEYYAHGARDPARPALDPPLDRRVLGSGVGLGTIVGYPDGSKCALDDAGARGAHSHRGEQHP